MTLKEKEENINNSRKNGYAHLNKKINLVMF